MEKSNNEDTRRTEVSDDALEIKVIPHPFKFEKSPNNELNELIVEVVNQMGGIGENAEKNYQKSLEKLQSNAEKVIPIIISEYNNLPEFQYLDRWSLIQLLVELKHPLALATLDEILTTPIPPERSKFPNEFPTRGEEIIIRTTAIEAVTRIASNDNKQAMNILVKHSKHNNFSIKRAAIQGSLKAGGEIAKKQLQEKLPKEDQFIMSIQQTNVRLVPQPSFKEFAKPLAIDDSPKKSRPKIRENKPLDSNSNSGSQKGGEN